MHIDFWTLALQTINVLVLVWLLARFLFRPVAAIIAERRAAADKLLADAAAQLQQTSDAAAALAKQRDGVAGEAQRVLAEARATAEAERATLLQHASDAASRLQADAQQAITRDQHAMREALEREASDLALTIAARLLKRVPAAALTHAFMESLAATLETDPTRNSLLGTTLELRSATQLDGAAQADCRAILSRILGAGVELSFRTDPTLIAGVELAAPHALIRNSWRADLDRITHALHEESANAIPQPVA
jgi:F-type H+-transporting ATPase subunit b